MEMSSRAIADPEDSEELLPLIRPCTHEEFSAAYRLGSKSSLAIMAIIKDKYEKCKVTAPLFYFFPILHWLPCYPFKQNMSHDIVAGLTVAVMHVSQGMAYASLGGVNPIVGIYMAVFPVAVYCLMGTSRHISLGTFAVVCLMTAGPVFTLSQQSGCSALQAAAVISVTVGLLQLVFGLCRAGSLAVFFSPALSHGFTTGASVLVVVSQLQHVVGIKLPKYFGPFNVVYTLSELVQRLPETNYLTVAMSVGVILFLILYTEYIKKRLACNCAFPLELAVIIIGTIMSHALEFEANYDVRVLGVIPTGFPSPRTPLINLAPQVILESLAIAVVSFTVNISMATIFATREDYKIKPNQELVATGCANIVGAFFSCLPISASLSRSMIQYTSGGKSQLAGIFSSAFLLSVVFYLGRFLEPLPYCVLAGIIIKSVIVIFWQVTDLPGIWKQSNADGIIWLSAFSTVILVNIEIGLCIAVALSLLSIIFMSQRTRVCLLGNVPNTDIYLELDSYLAAKPIPGFILIRVYGRLNFANASFTMEKILHMLEASSLQERGPQQITLVLDLLGVPFIDPPALQNLMTAISVMEKREIPVLITHCSIFVYRQMKKCDFLKHFSQELIFPTVHDAVLFKINNI